MFGVNELLPSNPLIRYLETIACDEKSMFEGFCENIEFLIAGYDPGQLNRVRLYSFVSISIIMSISFFLQTMLPMILGHFPAGSSTRTLLHYAQCVKSGEFRKYDFGKKKNQEVYGQKDPPLYDLSKVVAPVALYWGENDALGPPEVSSRCRHVLTAKPSVYSNCMHVTLSIRMLLERPEN